EQPVEGVVFGGYEAVQACGGVILGLHPPSRASRTTRLYAAAYAVRESRWAAHFAVEPPMLAREKTRTRSSPSSSMVKVIPGRVSSGSTTPRYAESPRASAAWASEAGSPSVTAGTRASGGGAAQAKAARSGMIRQ